jgi:hypothetical protein
VPGAQHLIGRELARVRNLRRFSRAPRYRARWPTTMSWGAVWALSAGSLLALGYLVGHGPPAGRHHGLWGSLDETVTQPSVSLPLAFAILTCSAYASRRLRLEWLARKPGRIQVPDFSTHNLTRASPAQLTSMFRDRLAQVRLDSSGVAPAAQPVSDFLDVLSAAQVASNTILGTLLGLLRAAVPRFAYELHGEVVQRDCSPSDYRVSVQIVRVPNQEGSQVEVTDHDLDRAIRRAADSATAAILPRTRLCKGPWITWRRYKMPVGLFNAYEDACEHEAQRRYDQAQDLYYQALERDPMNRMLRLQLGQLQEKLRMPLEALVTYTAMINSGSPAGRDLPPGLYTRRAERERTRALLIARYRRAVLLGNGSVMEEWFKAPAERHTDRARRDALRDQLKPWLEENHPATWMVLESMPEQDDLSSKQQQTVQQSLAKCATKEVNELRRDLPIAWRLVRNPPLTRRALGLAQLCIDQRTNYLDQHDDARSECALAEEVRRLRKQVLTVERSVPFGPRRPFRRWKEQYNAACFFAYPLLNKSTDDTTYNQELDELAKEAVYRLELAAASATSSFIARQREWVTAEDPDLDGLRRHRLFKAFESDYFPASAPIARLPKCAQHLAELRCTRDLLATAARSFEAVWRARAVALQAGERQDAVCWWSDEHEVWRRIHDVALNRDSRARLALTRATRKRHLSYAIEPIEPIFARYGEHAPAASQDDVEAGARIEIQEIQDRLLALAKMLSCRDGDGFRGFTSGVTALDVFDAEPAVFTPAMRSRFCDRQATIWHRLHAWLVSVEGSDEDRLTRSLDRELRRASWLWKRASVNARLRRGLG